MVHKILTCACLQLDGTAPCMRFQLDGTMQLYYVSPISCYTKNLNMRVSPIRWYRAPCMRLQLDGTMQYYIMCLQLDDTQNLNMRVSPITWYTKS